MRALVDHFIYDPIGAHFELNCQKLKPEQEAVRTSPGDGDQLRIGRRDLSVGKSFCPTDATHDAHVFLREVILTLGAIISVVATG